MKTVKPFRLSIVPRPYRWKAQDCLGVSVVALASLGEEPQLFSEQELWQTISEETGTGAVFDLGIPKAVPEVLVSGFGYTAHQNDKTVCAVGLRMAGLEKSLSVSGDRYWLGGRPTVPRPFDRMPLGWAHAYGGPGHAENPLGMGTVDEVINGVQVRRLPNVELPTARMVVQDRRVAPGSFDAMPPDWPQRMALLGEKYGRGWLEKDFPGFADDMDWRFFNAAPLDQRWPTLQELPAQAPYELRNMHPEKAILSGRLPDWRARCFLSFQKDGTQLRELALRLTTAWFFPHRERVALIWHGACPIAEDDAVDVKHIMPALELAGDPRTFDHYQQVLLRRVDPEKGAVHALRDSDLAPKAILGHWSAMASGDAMNSPMQRNLRAGRQRAYEAAHARLVAQGLDPDKYLAKPEAAAAQTDVEDFPELLVQLENQAMQEKKRARQVRRELSERPKPGVLEPAAAQTGEPTRHRFDPDALVRQLAQLDELPQGADGSPRWTPQMSSRMAMQIRGAYRYSAHLSAAARPMQADRTAQVRMKLQQADPAARDFAGMNLVGADLSGMDLRGANFSGAMLEDADLSGAMFDDCDFSRAVLARARLVRTSMAGCKLTDANLGSAHCESAVFSDADFSDANCHGTVFDSCNLAGATFSQTRLVESRWIRCDLRRTTWWQATLMKMSLQDLAFDGAVFTQTVWTESELHGTSFVGATFVRCGWIDTDCRSADFSEASLDACSFAHGTSLAGAVLRDALLKQCGLRTTGMQGADLTGARLDGSDFSECDLRQARLDRVVGGEALFVRADFTGASLRGANLIDANLSKAILSLADLSEANLFRADVSQALMEPSTRLDGAYTHGAKIWPVRRTENGA